MARVEGRRFVHLRDVLGVEIGQTLRVGLRDGAVGEATVVAMDADGVDLGVQFDGDPPPPAPVWLALALPRPLVLRRLLGQVTTLGIQRIWLFGANRVEKSYWQTPSLAPAAIERELVLGLEQARDTRLPRVEQHPRFRPFVEDVLAPLAQGAQLLVGHPGATTPCPRSVAERTVLVVGPEGGFIPYEIERLEAAGGTCVSLGPRILRTETAVIALLGRLAP